MLQSIEVLSAQLTFTGFIEFKSSEMSTFDVLCLQLINYSPLITCPKVGRNNMNYRVQKYDCHWRIVVLLYT